MTDASTSPDRKVVCVLGMHRSGTSAFTGILNLKGMDLGEPLEGKGENNPEGHWEYLPFRLLNDRLLGLLGGSWLAPPRFPSDWHRSSRLWPARLRARLITELEFGRSPFWGWKDPRTCLTLPFWREIAQPTHYVVCVRNPSDVAASLSARDQIPLQQSESLWQLYTRTAIEGTEGLQRLVVFYEDLMRHRELVTALIARFLELPQDGDGERSKAVTAFIRPELQHHATGPADVLADGRLAKETRALYETLRRRFAFPD